MAGGMYSAVCVCVYACCMLECERNVVHGCKFVLWLSVCVCVLAYAGLLRILVTDVFSFRTVLCWCLTCCSLMFKVVTFDDVGVFRG